LQEELGGNTVYVSVYIFFSSFPSFFPFFPPFSPFFPGFFLFFFFLFVPFLLFPFSFSFFLFPFPFSLFPNFLFPFHFPLCLFSALSFFFFVATAIIISTKHPAQNRQKSPDLRSKKNHMLAPSPALYSDPKIRLTAAPRPKTPAQTPAPPPQTQCKTTSTVSWRKADIKAAQMRWGVDRLQSAGSRINRVRRK
jgi:hypothetical protein